ncbi:MAG TPA: hypothetical protein PKD59_07605 [Miltoncostaeaceae bacterium]|nr:hypothetical protein [Miltoncostaeaceae bacterium]
MSHVRMIWLCIALVVAGIIAVAAGLAWGYLLIIIPGVLMIGAMAWMVLFDSGHPRGMSRR